MADNTVKRFADYSNADLAQLVIELEKAGDERLRTVLAEVRAELARRQAGRTRRFWQRVA
jgi:hypothetical protein